MSNVLTLVAAPGTTDLTLNTVERFRQALRAAGGEVSAPGWLAPDAACDLTFGGLNIAEAREAVSSLLSGLAADHAIQPLEGRRKALLLADMESTIIAQEMLDELAVVLGIGPKIAAITARAMAGELAFEESLRHRVALLQNLPDDRLKDVSSLMTLNPGARTLVQTMRAQGAYTALVSGGFTFFTAQIRERCGFHEDRANSLIIEDGRLTGAVAEPILGREAKQEALEELAGQKGIAAAAVCAVGDGANDLAMLSAAGMGVAYHGKAVVREAAQFSVDHGDLTTLLYFQGYRQDEFKS